MHPPPAPTYPPAYASVHHHTEGYTRPRTSHAGGIEREWAMRGRREEERNFSMPFSTHAKTTRSPSKIHQVCDVMFGQVLNINMCLSVNQSVCHELYSQKTIICYFQIDPVEVRSRHTANFIHVYMYRVT